MPRTQQAEVAPVQGGRLVLDESLHNRQDGDGVESDVRVGVSVADIPGPAVILDIQVLPEISAFHYLAS